MTQYWGVARLSTSGQTVSMTTSASGTTTTAFRAGVRKARILVTADSYVTIASTIAGSVTASSNATYVTGLVPEYFTVAPGEYVSAILVSSAASPGLLNVTEAL